MTIFGSDVSHYDSPDTRAMFADGIVFQTHKAGGDKTDAELGTWWTYVKSYRPSVLLGAYWVLYPGSPAERAASFLGRLDSTCPGWRDGPFILQADCEKWNGDASTVPSVSEVNTFCDALVKNAPKLVPIAYMPDWVYGDLSALRYPLWSSKYVEGAAGYKTLYPGDSSSKWAAYGGKTPAVLQYSSKATIGGQTTCDANAYKGTLAQLTALLAPGWIREAVVAENVTREWIVAVLNATLRGTAGTRDDGTGGSGGDVVPRWSMSGGPVAADDPNPTMSVASTGYYIGGPVRASLNGIQVLLPAVAKILENVQADDGESAQILAAIAASTDATVAGVMAALGQPDTSPEDVATALVSLLGKDRAAAVAAALATLAQ